MPKPPAKPKHVSVLQVTAPSDYTVEDNNVNSFPKPIISGGMIPYSISYNPSFGYYENGSYQIICTVKSYDGQTKSCSFMLIVRAVASIPTPPPSGTHPAVWLDATTITLVTSKKNTNDSKWLANKATADALVAAAQKWTFTITGINSNPCQLIIAEGVPWAAGTFPVYIAGGTGPWAAINNITFPGITATRINATTISIPVDSSAFGSFAGQTISLFPYNASLADDSGTRYSYQGLGWSDDCMQPLALCYRITGDVNYANKGRELLRYIAKLGKTGNLEPVSADSYFATRGVLLALGIGYDWLFDQLTAQEKLDCQDALSYWYDQIKVNALEISGPTSSNYFTGHILGLSTCILGMPEHPRYSEITNYIINKINTIVTPSFATGGELEGGGIYESYGYGTNALERLLWTLFAFKTATSNNYYSSFARKLSRSLIYNLRPNKWQTPDEGDWPGNYVGILNPSYPITLAYAADGFNESGYMQYLYQNIAANPYGAGAGDPIFSKLLWYDPTRSPIDYTAIETPIYDSPGDCHLIWRNNWTPSAVWMQFNGGCTNQAGHQARAFGNYEIQRSNDYFNPYAGQWKGLTGVVEDGNPVSFNLMGCYANTLFHADGGVYNFIGDAYVGGMGYWGFNNVLKREINGTNGHAYHQADLTAAYHTNNGGVGRSLTTFVRSIVFQASGIAVIFDRILRGNAGYTDIFRSHYHELATVNLVGDQVNVTLGSSKLTEKFLLPSSKTITKDRDFTNPTDTGSQTTIRVNITDAAPTVNMLHMKAIRVAPNTDPDPTITLITASGTTAYGCSVTDGADTVITFFSANGSVLNGLSYTEP